MQEYIYGQYCGTGDALHNVALCTDTSRVSQQRIVRVQPVTRTTTEGVKESIEKNYGCEPRFKFTGLQRVLHISAYSLIYS